jgi:hypothetical protein
MDIRSTSVDIVCIHIIELYSRNLIFVIVIQTFVNEHDRANLDFAYTMPTRHNLSWALDKRDALRSCASATSAAASKVI